MEWQFSHSSFLFPSVNHLDELSTMLFRDLSSSPSPLLYVVNLLKIFSFLFLVFPLLNARNAASSVCHCLALASLFPLDGVADPLLRHHPLMDGEESTFSL